MYAAASPSLAVVEVLVLLDLPAALLPDDPRLVRIEILDDVTMQALDPSPTNDADCRMAGEGERRFAQAMTALWLKPHLDYSTL